MRLVRLIHTGPYILVDPSFAPTQNTLPLSRTRSFIFDRYDNEQWLLKAVEKVQSRLDERKEAVARLQTRGYVLLAVSKLLQAAIKS